MASNVRTIIMIKCKLEHLRAQSRNQQQRTCAYTAGYQTMYMYSSVPL